MTICLIQNGDCQWYLAVHSLLVLTILAFLSFCKRFWQEKSTVLGQRAILRIATCNLGGSVLLAVLAGVVRLREERRAKLVVGIGVEEQA